MADRPKVTAAKPSNIDLEKPSDPFSQNPSAIAKIKAYLRAKGSPKLK